MFFNIIQKIVVLSGMVGSYYVICNLIQNFLESKFAHFDISLLSTTWMTEIKTIGINMLPCEDVVTFASISN